MSKIGCICGHVIRDQTDSLAYKALMVLDVDAIEMGNWIDLEINSYFEAVKNSDESKWLIDRGVTTDYLNYENHHAIVVRDCILGRVMKLQKYVYECHSCGRLLVEGNENEFLTYEPETKKNNNVLAISKRFIMPVLSVFPQSSSLQKPD